VSPGNGGNVRLLTAEKAIEAVKLYRKKGWRVFPLPAGQKKPDREEGWLRAAEKVSDDTVAALWARGENVGVILDPPLVDVDLDCDEAVRLAPRFLPSTPMRFKRKSNPGWAHWVYEVQDCEHRTFVDTAARERKNGGDTTAKEMILEIRSGENGDHYTMFPPSVHPSGEQLNFAPGGGWPEVVLANHLRRHCELLAATALMVRHWPGPGTRNEATLALAGALVRAEREKLIEPDEVNLIVKAIVEEGGNSDPASDFGTVQRTRDTFAKIDGGNDKKKVKGWTSLERLLGAQGKTVVHDFRDWLGVQRRRGKRASSPLLQAPFAEQIIWEIDGQGNKVPARIAANVQIIVTNDLLADDEEGEARPLIYHDDFAGSVMLADAPPWASRQVPYPRELADTDLVMLQGWLAQTWGLSVRKEAVYDGVGVAADLCARHEVQDYLNGLRWDGVERLSAMGRTYLAADDDDYTRSVIRMWMISAVARAKSPGCQVNHALVLEGKTQIGKSSGLRALCPNELWFSDTVLDMRTKEGALVLRGSWIIEIAELASIRRTDVETVKEYLTRRIDEYRPPYGKLKIKVPRSNVFACTVNPDQDDGYLRDPTGNARFWPVECRGYIDTEGLTRDRDQLWAEARAAYEADEKWHPTDEAVREEMEKRQARRLSAGRFAAQHEADIFQWLCEKESEDGRFAPLGLNDQDHRHLQGWPFRFTVADLQVLAIGIRPSEVKASRSRDVKPMGQIVTRMGLRPFVKPNRGTHAYEEGDNRVELSWSYVIEIKEQKVLTALLEEIDPEHKPRPNPNAAGDGDDDIPF
jgi:predicted P-loop ATPase